MATYTPNLNLEKPEASDEFKDFRASYNGNMDIIDQALEEAGTNLAELYDDTATYSVGDYVVYEGILYKCDTPVTVAETFDPTKWTQVAITDEMGGGTSYTAGDGINISLTREISVDTAFTEASTRANINSGDTLATIWGKIKKFFSDLKTVAFTGSYNDLSDKPTIPDISTKVSKSGDTMSGTLTINSGLKVQGRVSGSGDDEGIVVDFANNSYAGVILGNPNGKRSAFYYNSTWSNPVWRFNDGNSSYDISHPKKGGTIALTSDLPDISTKVSKSGDTMTGLLNLNTTNNVAINFRPNNNDYNTTVSYQTAGNEACVFATKSGVTSFIFINGEDSITNHDGSRWQSLTPALQIKNNCVAIGKLIANGVTPSYKLEVDGNANVTGTLVSYEGANIYKSDSTPLTIDSGTTDLCAIQFRGLGHYSLRLFYADRYDFGHMYSASNKQPLAYRSEISSRRYKENILPMTEEDCKRILDVDIVTFDYRADKDVVAEKDRKDNRGVIAEDVVKVIPQVVTYAEIDGEEVPNGVNYTKFIPYLIKMVQMQQKEIDELKAIIKGEKE